MKRLTKWLKILSAAVVVTVAASIILFPSTTVRYRLTLEANVDGEPTIGSSVIEVSYGKKLRLLPNESELYIDVRGEAVALELRQRGFLFALLKGGEDSRSGAETIVLRAFNFPGGILTGPVEEGISHVHKLSGKVELPLTSLPLLVRFRDITDPLTVEKVDPLDLEKSFGPDVKLTRATLEIVPSGIWPLSWFGITGEPITTGIDRKLEWLNHLDQYRSIPSNPFSSTLPSEISGFRSR